MFALAALPAHARIGLIVGEPFGRFGTMLPVGHASVLLDDYCSSTPTTLRPCLPGERPGVVLSRYHDLRHPQLDWLATPALTFFYGVEDPGDLPAALTPQLKSTLRERYRAAHLADVISLRDSPSGDWAEAIGAAFDRRLFVYTLDASPDDEAAIATFLNTSPNRRRYSLGRHNCADFATVLLALALPPGTLHRNRLADFDIMTPRQLARLMDAFSHAHPERHPAVLEIPQLPGTLPRSRPLRGASDTFLKTKRYLATLLVLQPELVLADWIVYEERGKWRPTLAATVVTPAWLQSTETETARSLATDRPDTPTTPALPPSPGN